jgi:hypothetical protein
LLTRLAKGFAGAMLVMLAMCAIFGASDPVGPQLESTNTESAQERSALLLNTSGGTLTTLVLNGTTQNLGWKAYVGNVTGRLVLADGDNYSVFEWQLSATEGEVYATRKSAMVNWSNIDCASEAHVNSEDSAMNKSSADVDSIESTFSNTTHAEFFAGSKRFIADACDYTVATYVDNSPQYTKFQEVLLYDGDFLVYTALIENSTRGFDNSTYDFQMLVAEDRGKQTNTGYYFYVEIG